MRQVIFLITLDLGRWCHHLLLLRTKLIVHFSAVKVLINIYRLDRKTGRHPWGSIISISNFITTNFNIWYPLLPRAGVAMLKLKHLHFHHLARYLLLAVTFQKRWLTSCCLLITSCTNRCRWRCFFLSKCVNHNIYLIKKSNCGLALSKILKIKNKIPFHLKFDLNLMMSIF